MRTSMDLRVVSGEMSGYWAVSGEDDQEGSNQRHPTQGMPFNHSQSPLNSLVHLPTNSNELNRIVI
jgi:hypothetical protein